MAEIDDRPLPFFVVRRWHDRELFSFEYGDFSGLYSKEEKLAINYRTQLRERMTLTQAIAFYRAGVRLKPIDAKKEDVSS